MRTIAFFLCLLAQTAIVSCLSTRSGVSISLLISSPLLARLIRPPFNLALRSKCNGHYSSPNCNSHSRSLKCMPLYWTFLSRLSRCRSSKVQDNLRIVTAYYDDLDITLRSEVQPILRTSVSRSPSTTPTSSA